VGRLLENGGSDLSPHPPLLEGEGAASPFPETAKHSLPSGKASTPEASIAIVIVGEGGRGNRLSSCSTS